MAKKQQYLYGKFKLHPDVPLMEAYTFSPNKAFIDAWSGEKEKGKHEEKKENKQIDISTENLFLSVFNDLISSFSRFQNSIPFMMSSLPVMRNISDDLEIRGFFKKNGTLLEEDGFEVYQLDIKHFSELQRRITKAREIDAGIRALPSMFIISLIASYDSFLSQLIRAIFLTQPEILNSSDKQFSFKEILSFGDFQSAKENLIEREIDTIIRDSHYDQIKWLEKCLKIKIDGDQSLLSEFLEICERRNLLTHTDGIVSEQYIQNCRKYVCDIKNIKTKQRISINKRYYTRAVQVVMEFGIKLTQVIWRKLRPDDIQSADTALNEFAYNLISTSRYEEAIRILKFGRVDIPQKGSDRDRKMMTINYANALKLNNDFEAAKKILNEEDWSAATIDFLICKAAVLNDTKEIIRLMEKAVTTDSIKIEHFQIWPVFKNVREDPDFIREFENKFGEKLITSEAGVEKAAPISTDLKDSPKDQDHLSVTQKKSKKRTAKRNSQ